MSGASIAKKVKKGLAKASVKTGNGTATAYLINKITTGGTKPSDPATVVEDPVLLVDAITKSYMARTTDSELIRTTEVILVANGDIIIAQNDEVEVNGKRYIVLYVDAKNPSNVPLAYICYLRSK